MVKLNFRGYAFQIDKNGLQLVSSSVKDTPVTTINTPIATLEARMQVPETDNQIIDEPVLEIIIEEPFISKSFEAQHYIDELNKMMDQYDIVSIDKIDFEEGYDVDINIDKIRGKLSGLKVNETHKDTADYFMIGKDKVMATDENITKYVFFSAMLGSFRGRPNNYKFETPIYLKAMQVGDEVGKMMQQAVAKVPALKIKNGSPDELLKRLDEIDSNYIKNALSTLSYCYKIK